MGLICLQKLPFQVYIQCIFCQNSNKEYLKNVNQLETLIAHSLPDTAQNTVSPFAIFALMLVFDWRLGLVSLLPLVLAFVLQMLLMRISSSSGFMQKYEDALEQMPLSGVIL